MRSWFRLPLMPKNARGVTLVELMVAVALLSVGVLGFFGAFQFITKSISVSRARTLSTNLAQERVEALKNLNYYSLLITTSSLVDNAFTPGVTYDNGNYAPETISIGGVDFKRYTYVSLAQIDNNVISTVTYTYPDTGMKQITVHVTWNQLGERKKWTLSNILENPNINPLDGSFTGYITSAVTSVAIGGAVVKVQENPDWNATTDSGGYYTFRVYHGSYTLRVSSGGWYDTVSSIKSVETGGNTDGSLSMTKIASGTIAGSAWVNPDLVISQIVVSCITYSGDGVVRDIEYVELFNPTTAPIAIGVTGGPKQVQLNYYGENGLGGDRTDAEFAFNHDTSTFVPAGRYYLISNASHFMIDGGWYRADAYYGALYDNRLINNNAGAIRITRGVNILDTVGWEDDTGATAPMYEGSPIPDSTARDGLDAGSQAVRVSSPGCSFDDTGTYGKAYDSGNNAADFYYPNNTFTFPPLPLFYTPRSTTHSPETVISGKPAIGAYVAADDTFSGSTIAYRATISSNSLSLPYAKFVLTGVTTGTWTVVISSGGYYKEVRQVVTNAGVTTPIPNAATDPAWPISGAYQVNLDSSHTGGFVEGRVTSITGAAIPNITVLVGGTSKVTGTNGNYFSKVSSGPISLIANPNNANSTYIQSIVMADVQTGQTLTQDFTLSQGGVLRGFCTTGTTPLPNIVVTANISGSQYGTGTSDATGVWTIPNLATGTYVVSPVLEAGQDSSPNTLPGVVLAADTVTVGTFTVAGAFGSITGTVTYLGTLVTSGALILASTATIASTPPAIAGSSAPAQTPLYAVSSKADGTYTLPVRGSATSYKLSVYIPTIAASGTVSVTTKTHSGISVTASQATTLNITVP